MCKDTEVSGYAKITTLGKARIHSTATPLVTQESKDSPGLQMNQPNEVKFNRNCLFQYKILLKKMFSAFSATSQVAGYKLQHQRWH